MSIYITSKADGTHRVSGVTKKYSAYERSILKGKIPCPYTVKFSQGRKITHTSSVRLTPNGNVADKKILSILREE